MKKLLTPLVLMLSLGGWAQQPAEGKQTLIVDLFARAREVPPPYVEQLRGRVAEAFMLRGRHRVLDAARIETLAPAALLFFGPGAGPHTPGLPLPPVEPDRLQAAREAGARYLLGGTVTRYLFKHESAGDKPSFRASFTLVLRGWDLADGTPIEPETFELSGTGPTAEQADLKAMESLSASKMEYFIDRRFKFTTAILRLEPPNAKGKYKELYLNCGSSMGVRNGDLFLVYRLERIGEALSRRKIGKVRAREVTGPEVTRCTISNGGEQIAAAVAAAEPLLVVSDSQALF